jgi:SAM-dependent methyltransferase
VTTDLHRARLVAVLGALRARGARSVLDLGCGDGALLLALVAAGGFDRLAGVEIDPDRLTAARARPELGGVAFLPGSMTDRALLPTGFDAAVMVETVEHLPPDRLGALEAAVFAAARPGVVLVTTPNADFTPLLGVPAHRRRRADHAFEWGRARFRGWATGVAARRGYAVAFADLPALHGDLGGPSQMAIFDRLARRPDFSSARASAIPSP